MNDRTDPPARGDLVVGPERYGWLRGEPGFVDAVREDNLESVKPPEPDWPFAEVPRSLLTHEQQAKFLPSPRRNHWREIQRFDERVAEVDAHQRELTEESQRIAEELRTAPVRDGDTFATWALTRKGPDRNRPSRRSSSKRARSNRRSRR